MTAGGMQTRPSGTLVDRALDYLASGPVDSCELARRVLGVAAASPPIADRLAAALLGSDPRVQRRYDARWELVMQEARSPLLSTCSFAVVDVETTGSSPRRGDRIIEIAIAVLSQGSVEMVLDRLVNPERVIPRVITGITRITEDDVRGQPTFTEIAPEVVSALAGRIFVAHNARFDWAFVSHETHRALDVVLDGPRLCTVQMARRFIPGLRSRGLDSVARYFGIEIEGRHRAGGDAKGTALALSRMLELAAERGIETLGGLAELLQRPPRKRKRGRRQAMPTGMSEA